ncbi:probable tocopherol O-methyltransferase, chloroplastic [Selaginella moellendorffii]|uniref:probable tocopherol O-methyltransferase, chloroplastic n=1 Tax=Selaginella moellendorffii TaxID=88036 RepID=UPI000D1C3C4F|nr:probable tocopherol O-methyltransferase, chloroplastic [Selaginella moellendorffii]|eukprot:XP_024529091.1 probable tocopherol O-methyltransferase, chloroplastic [Selaginella moellendorffii]
MASEIEEIYDEGCVVYEAVWGEHMHSGYFEAGKPGDFRVAQVRMIEEVLSWAGVPNDEQSRPRDILDVGCGFGGTSRYLSKKYSANVKGIALSDYEIASSIAPGVKVEDWTQHMLPFWGLLTAEIFTLRGAFKILTSGFKTGIFKYAVVMGKKGKN